MWFVSQPSLGSGKEPRRLCEFLLSKKTSVFARLLYDKCGGSLVEGGDHRLTCSAAVTVTMPFRRVLLKHSEFPAYGKLRCPNLVLGRGEEASLWTGP